MENKENYTDTNDNQDVYESYVFKFNINLDRDTICGQNSLNIELFDSCFGEDDTDFYVPVVGVVKGTNTLCYGVRCCEDNIIFKIYDKDSQAIHLVYIVDNIATVIDMYSPNVDTRTQQFKHYKVMKRTEEVRNINVEKMLNIMKSYADNPTTEVEDQFASDYCYKDQLFALMTDNLISMAKAIYFSVVSNFLVKYNVFDIKQLTDEKMIIKKFDNCKDRYNNIDPVKFSKMFKDVDVEDWFNLFEEVKAQLPDYQVFEEVEETAFDVFAYTLENEDDYTPTYYC